MENDILEFLPALLLDGVWIGIAIFLTVQALKIMEILKSELWLKRSPIITGLILGAVWFVAEMFPVTQPVIFGLFRAYAGGLTAAIAYPYVLKPLFEKLGIPITHKELSK